MLIRRNVNKETFPFKSAIYLNCGVLGTLLIPLKRQRKVAQSSQETIKLLEKNDIEMLMLEKPLNVKEAEQDVLRNIVQ